ncbi:MAG TPA: EAL domain-containing protein [Rhodocyclaceae bacterium]|nr:EAL domain-containing protein [Rhodocyclaceae bacterium]
MRVLYVEDSAIDARLAQRAFATHAPDIVLEIVPTIAQARQALDRDACDVLLTDLRLPDGSGLELLDAGRPGRERPPVVLVTGAGDAHAAMAALRAGAHDYVVKNDGYLVALPARLRSARDAAWREALRSRPLHVLHCGRPDGERSLLRNHLARAAPHLRLEAAGSTGEVLAWLAARDDAAGRCDVVLAEHRPPQFDALELVRRLRHERALAVPVVLSVAEACEELAARALQLGADDLVVQDGAWLDMLPHVLEKVSRARQVIAERQRREALEDRYKQVLAASPALTYRLRLEGERRIPVWVSENVERMLGYAPGACLSPDWWWANLHAEDQAHALAAQHEVVRRGELDIEYRFRHRSGRLLWIHDRQRLVRNAEGKPVEIVGTWNDVTDETIASRVRAARIELREMKLEGQSLQSILEATVRQVERCFGDCRAAIVLADRGGRRITHRAVASLGEDYRACLGELGEALLAALAGRPDEQPFEVHVGTADRTVDVWHRLAAASGLAHGWHQPLPPGDGRIPGVLAVYARQPDTPAQPQAKWLNEFALLVATAAKRSEQEAIQRQAFAALANTRDGIVITDLAPAIVSVNHAWTEITGYGAEESLGRNPSMLRSGLQNPESHESMWRTLLATGYWQGEVWNRRKNGEVYPQLLSITTVRDEAGAPTHYVGVMTDLSRLRRSEAEKERLTHFDPLTQLPNRLLALSRLQHAIERARRQSHAIGVLHLDLDHFKRINDSLGHAVGDDVLVELAGRLQKQLHEDMTLARLGGDEFLIIVEQLEMPDDTARLARRLVDSLRRPVVVADGQQVYPSASLGICIFPDDGGTSQELLQRAETAMYEAKRRGRDQYCFYTEPLGEAVRQRLAIESHLRLALERGELALHYQPQVDIRSGLVNGVEALMRWHSPELGEVPPGIFIPVAEQSGLIFQLGTWALEEACRQNKRWQDEGLPQLCVAVNVSVRQFKDRNLISTVRRALERSGLPPRCLEVELTESAFVDDVETAIRTSRELHELGVRLSLDDFGTGYSSLAYLSRFAFDKIKIDQSFVADITSNPTNAAIAITTIALADSLRIAVLAEGVETEGQLDFLRRRGCASMQGYLFSRPLSPDDLATLLREARRLPAPDHVGERARTLLLLDDEPNILRALQRLLRPDGYRILATTRPSEAFDLLAQHHVQVVVSDQRMPDMNGTEFLSRVKDLHPETVRIVLSGYSEVETITQAVNRGAIYKFFTKPWDDARLRDELREAFRVAERAGRSGRPPEPAAALPQP